jgi:hypothetical protein
MILNKFNSGSVSNTLKTFCLQLLALCLFSCKKNANENANKAYVGLTHVAYNVGPLGLSVAGLTLFSDSTVIFGQTTGPLGDPYDTVTSQVSAMELYQGTTANVLLKGNAAFQQGGHYSVFAYDSMDQQSISLIIFQDNPPAQPDSITNIRFINFSPGPIIWGLKMINQRLDIPYAADTVLVAAAYFVGYNTSPNSYPFVSVRSGMYTVFAFRDSSNPTVPDSSNFVNLGNLNIDSTINYDIYLQGFYGINAGADSFQLKHLPLD